MLFNLLSTQSVAVAMPAARPVEDSLVLQIAEGNKEALATLYTATKSAVYGFALSILKNPHSAEDVMQETYLHIYQNAYWYRPQGKPMAWIFTIVRNLALMKLRDESARETPTDLELLPETSQDKTQDSLNRMMLRAALKILSDEERQIVILFSVSGLKHREIAEILHIPISTELTKYHRALNKLKNHLQKEDENNA